MRKLHIDMQIILSKIAFGNFHAHSIHTEVLLFLSRCINRKLFTHESGIPQDPINMVYLRLKTIVMILHNYRKSGALFAWVATKNTIIINFLLFLYFFLCVSRSLGHWNRVTIAQAHPNIAIDCVSMVTEVR